MWTYASLEAESEGLVEHTTFPFPLPPPLPVQSIFQYCSLFEKERKSGSNFQESPKNTALSVDKDGHVPFGVRDRNLLCALMIKLCFGGF